VGFMFALRPCLRLRHHQRSLLLHSKFYSVDQKHFLKVKQQLSLELSRLETEHTRLLRAVQTGHDASKEGVSIGKQNKDLRPLEIGWSNWLAGKKNFDDAVALLQSDELFGLAQEECRDVLTQLTRLAEVDFPALFVTPSKTAGMSALMELKSGVGGSESSLFLAELMRVYMRFANTQNYVPSIVAKSDSDTGGVKGAILEIQGAGAYDALRWESGVHRVQRVPATESSGRVHTSTVAIVVLPLIEDPQSGEEDLFKMEDIRLEVMRARGAGGQHVNKTESAVRITHIPTGITVSMQDERSQHQNRRRAFQVLRARLMDLKIIREQAEHRAARRDLVRTADRSEKIRTYNSPQDRVTDHRLGKKHFSWEDVMENDGFANLINDLNDKHTTDIVEEKLLSIT